MPQKPNKKLLIDFGTRIRDLRTSRNLSQEQLAELTGFHRTYIGMVERGERNLSITNVAIFADVFEISVAKLTPEIHRDPITCAACAGTRGAAHRKGERIRDKVKSPVAIARGSDVISYQLSTISSHSSVF